MAKKGETWKCVKSDRRWELLIYEGRIPDVKVDPGTWYSPEVLKGMYQKKKLMGRALEDAKKMFPEIKV